MCFSHVCLLSQVLFRVLGVINVRVFRVIFDFRKVELAWDNASKRIGSSNHEKPTSQLKCWSSEGWASLSARSRGDVPPPVYNWGGAPPWTCGAGHRRGRARQTRPMRSRRPPCRRQQRIRRASLHSAQSMTPARRRTMMRGSCTGRSGTGVKARFALARARPRSSARGRE